MPSLVRRDSNAPSEILPKGDTWPLGRPRRQFHLKTLVLLLTIAAAALGLGSWLGWSPGMMFVLTGVLVLLWWPCAQLYDPPQREPRDQKPLREEVRQWQTAEEHSAQR